MQTKLTLRIDEALIEKAKRLATARGTSVSKMVARLIEVMPESEGQNESQEQDLDPWTRSLIGMLNTDSTDRTNPPPTDEQVKEQYYQYLEEKYR
jgi:Family of unknown function (DUF6364)